MFRVTDASRAPVWMHWDDAGLATRSASGRADDPEFSASLENWRGFFEGRFTAGMAVLRFKINFAAGPARPPLHRGLNAFARVARPLAVAG